MVQLALTSPAPAPDATRDAAIFFSYAAAASILFVACVRAARPRADTIGFVLAPLLSLALTFENVALGADALAGGGGGGGVGGGAGAPGVSRAVADGALKLRGAVQAFVVPLWLTALFEITYTVHKRRSANFLLGLFTFDQGHRASHSLLSQGLRWSLWVLGASLLLLCATLNAPYVADPRGAPRAARFSYKGQPLGAGRAPGPLDAQDVADVVPWAVFLAWALAAGASLWRYGTLVSTDINATCVNAWAALAAAAAALTAAWVVSPPAWAFPYATNAAELALLAATALSMRLVESNLHTLEEWDRVLNAAGKALELELEKRRWAAAAEREGGGAGGAGGAGGGAGGTDAAASAALAAAAAALAAPAAASPAPIREALSVREVALAEAAPAPGARLTRLATYESASWLGPTPGV